MGQPHDVCPLTYVLFPYDDVLASAVLGVNRTVATSMLRYVIILFIVIYFVWFTMFDLGAVGFIQSFLIFCFGGL